MISLLHLQQRQQVYRPNRQLSRKLLQPYHKNLPRALKPSIFEMNSWTWLNWLRASAKLIKVAVVLSLALCSMAAVAWSAAQSHRSAANGQSVGFQANPVSWARAFTIFAPRASGIAPGHIDSSDGLTFEIAASAAPAGQTPPAQQVPRNVAWGLIYALTDADKEQAEHAMKGGKEALQQPVQAAMVELPPIDPAGEP